MTSNVVHLFANGGGAQTTTVVAGTNAGYMSDWKGPQQIQREEAPEDTVLRAVNAQLALLPSPLQFKGSPLMVTVETWSDGVVQARWPETALYGEGDNDSSALDALRERLLEFATDMATRIAQGARIGGPLLSQWNAFQALVDVSGLAGAAK